MASQTTHPVLVVDSSSDEGMEVEGSEPCAPPPNGSRLPAQVGLDGYLLELGVGVLGQQVFTGVSPSAVSHSLTIGSAVADRLRDLSPAHHNAVAASLCRKVMPFSSVQFI